MKSEKYQIDYSLDITGDVCPMTFVKTRLQIEKMSSGETLEIRLKGSEPLKNVPESVTELGHRIVSLSPEGAAGSAHGEEPIHRLIVEKA